MSKVKRPIELHHFMHPLYKAKSGENDTIVIELLPYDCVAKLHKDDVIAMAKHFDLEVIPK